jgi:hypothetical protein
VQNYEIIVADAVHCSGCCWRGLPPPPTQQVVRLACAIGGFSPALTKTRESKPDPPGIKTRPSGNQNPALRESKPGPPGNTAKHDGMVQNPALRESKPGPPGIKTQPSGNQNPALRESKPGPCADQRSPARMLFMVLVSRSIKMARDT